MNRRCFDPDVTRRDDGAYWAAALVLAIRANDRLRIDLARQRLAALGYNLHTAKKLPAKGVPHAR